MLLVIDAGNTNIVFGLFQGEQLIQHFRMTTGIERTQDEYGMFMLQMFQITGFAAEIRGVAIASVVLKVLEPLKSAVKKYFDIEAVIVDTSMDVGIKICYENPKELGPDRFVNAVAAYHFYQTAVIVVDFGTATTLGAVNAKGEFLGGAICPGIQVSLEALTTKTSRLPGVNVHKPTTVIGTNTVSNIQAGVFYGQIGQVEYLIRRFKQEMLEASVRVIATGGLSGVIADASREIDEIRENLTLEGLRFIYHKVKGS